ncbi:MAG: hypothetical protein Q6L60_12845 [Thermostichus sp. HHBFW_bins_43]
MADQMRRNGLVKVLVAIWASWAGSVWAAPGASLQAGIRSSATYLAAAVSIPWDWVYGLRDQAQQRQCTMVGLLRSEPLPSPNPEWQVYTRLDLVATPQMGRLTSVLFAENTRTRTLQVLYQASASVLDPWEPLDFAMILPLAWRDHTLLAREYEGWFQTDLSWDRAVIWPLPASSAEIPPVQIWDPPPVLGYTQLLGWDPQAQERVLFAVADSLGELPRLVSVGADQKVVLRGTAVNPAPAPPSSSEGWASATPTGEEAICHPGSFGLED